MKRKILCFDLDNTLCVTHKNFYKKSIPKIKIIKLINELYQEDYYIKIFTSRYMGRTNENIKEAKKLGFNFTQNQLKRWGIKYHKLIFGKPSYDIFVDDKSYGFKKNWHLNLRKHLKK